MGLAIPIETSARHIHMCQEDFEHLFGKGKTITHRVDLSQVSMPVKNALRSKVRKEHLKMLLCLDLSVMRHRWRFP